MDRSQLLPLLSMITLLAVIAIGFVVYRRTKKAEKNHVTSSIETKAAHTPKPGEPKGEPVIASRE